MNTTLPHYNQLNFPDNVLSNFWKKVNIPKDYVKDCWLWTAALNIDGYGVFSINDGTPKRQHYRSHRFVYQSYFGKITNGLLVCHTCDIRNCVNPHHLFLGTIQQNNLDCDNKNRRSHLSGDDLPNTIISDSQVEDILEDILNNKYNSVQDICSIYDVGLITIWDILYGKTRKDISKFYDLSVLKIKLSARINNDELILIKNDFNAGFSIPQLMKKYNRSRYQINYSIYKRTVK